MAQPRIGSVDSLNAVPLTRGIEDEVWFGPPSVLAERLRAGELVAGLVSIAEVLAHAGYEVLDGIAIVSRGPVASVLLGHRLPLDKIRRVHCDPASLTSVKLLKVLLAERGLWPEFVPLSGYGARDQAEAVLLIGDRALELGLAPGSFQIWDLGAAWQELSGLPFVYAAWALRRTAHTAELRRKLRAARDRGLEELETIAAEHPEWERAFCRRYLGGNIRYELGPDEKRGLHRFARLLAKHGLGPTRTVHFVD